MSNNAATTGTTTGVAISGDPAGTTADAKTYTQAQLDAMFGERAKSATATARADLLRSLGFEKEDDAKAAITNFKKLEDERKTNEQKLADRNAQLEKDIADTKAREKAANSLAEERLLRSAVLSEATKLGFVDAEDAWTFADKSKLSVDGEAVKGAKDVAEAVLKAKPHLKGGLTPKPPNTNAVNQNNALDAEARKQELVTRFRIPIRR